RGADDERSGATEQVAAADQQDCSGAVVRQDPGGDGAFGRKVFLCERCVQGDGKQSSNKAGDGQRTGICPEERTLSEWIGGARSEIQLRRFSYVWKCGGGVSRRKDTPKRI